MQGIGESWARLCEMRGVSSALTTETVVATLEIEVNSNAPLEERSRAVLSLFGTELGSRRSRSRNGIYSSRSSKCPPCIP